MNKYLIVFILFKNSKEMIIVFYKRYTEVLLVVD